MSITTAWQHLTQEIASLTSRPVAIMAVTKQRSVEEIREVVAAGARLCGENRVEEMCEKWRSPALEKERALCDVHMIGQLQSRKARDAITVCDMFHGVDRSKIVDVLERRCAENGRESLDVLIEINASGESQKAGVSPDDAEKLATRVCTATHLRLCGVMTMAPYTSDEKILRTTFARTRACAEMLAQRVGCAHMSILSMGMTNDYRIAIEEGSTMVRIGSFIFDHEEIS